MTTTWSFSQENTPVAKEINGHTYVLISPAQLKFANLRINEANFYNRVAVSYVAMTDSLKVEVETFRRLYYEKNKQTEDLKKNEADLKTQLTMQEDHYEGIVKHFKKKVRNAWFIGIPIGAILGLIASIFI